MALRYSGVWRTGDDPYYLWANAPWDTFHSKWQELRDHGQRLVSLDYGLLEGQTVWTGAWRASEGRQVLARHASWDELLTHDRELAAQGMRPTIVKKADPSASLPWIGVWHAGSGSYYLWANADWPSFVAKFEELGGLGLRLVDIDSYLLDGQRRWAGVWQAGTGSYYVWGNADWAAFQAKWQELNDRSLRLVRLVSYNEPGGTRYAGVWTEGSDGYYLWTDDYWASFYRRAEELAASGLRLVDVVLREAPPTPLLRLHTKVLTRPQISIEEQVAAMQTVYQTVGILVEHASTEQLNLPSLDDLLVGSCVQGGLTGEQRQLFDHRSGVGEKEFVNYYIRSTFKPYNGCAVHPAGKPGAVVVFNATLWTLAHELGHVLGLGHVPDPNRLMTGAGTANITNPPPDLVQSEVEIMLRNPHLQWV